MRKNESCYQGFLIRMAKIFPFNLFLLLLVLTSLMGCVSSPSINSTINSITPITPVITPLRADTIERAQTIYGPDYTFPAYLPKGYTFTEADYYDGPDERIDTFFSGDFGRLQLIQHKEQTPLCAGIISKNMVQIDVNGYNGTFISGENNLNQLSWYSGNYSFCLTGSFRINEMKMIAESIS